MMIHKIGKETYTTESYISIRGADPVPFDSLTPEQKEECTKVIFERIGKAVESYIARHPEQYEQIKAAIIASGGTVRRVPD